MISILLLFVKSMTLLGLLPACRQAGARNDAEMVFYCNLISVADLKKTKAFGRSGRAGKFAVFGG